MANSRISSNKRLCYRYRCFFVAAIIILFIQILIGYNTGIISTALLKKNDKDGLGYCSIDERPRYSSSKKGEEIDDGHDPPPEPTEVYEPKIYAYPHANLSVEGVTAPYHPPCALTEKETLSAISRAHTGLCKQEIADAACLNAENKLFPTKLHSFCHLKGNYTKGHYLGCFKDKTIYMRDLYLHQTTLKNNMPSVCINYCLQIGYRYAGVQYGNECFCGKSYGKYGQVADAECSYPCAGDKNKICGGVLRNSVYSTGIYGPLKNKFDLVHSTNKTKEERVRIVFVLTINGRQVRQVRRLLKAIYHTRHYYFIHVDMRQEYLYRELFPLESLLPNIFLARRRFATIWGGISLLQAHLEFMKEVLNKDWKWDYYINLSESDYPIKKLESLEIFLTEYKGHTFVKSHGHDTARFIRKQGLDKMFVECDTHMWRLGPKTLPTNIIFDGGSDWVALHRGFAQYVITSEDSLVSGLKTFYKYSLLPAESFFHTVLHNSEFCDKWMDNNLHLTNWRRAQGCKCQHKHVVDWCGCSPNVLTTHSLDKLMVKGQCLMTLCPHHTYPVCCRHSYTQRLDKALKYESKATYFARKFDPVIDQDIINSMDVYMFGKDMRDVRALTDYWQNEYHYLDDKEATNDVYLTFYSSFSRRSVIDLLPQTTGQCLVTPTQIVEANVLYQKDRFHGVIVKYNGQVKDGGSVMLETHLVEKWDYKVLDPTGPMGRFINIQIGSNFDVKENIFRNYAKLLGPYSEIEVKHMWGPGPEFTVSVAFIDPADIVAVAHDVDIPKSGHIGSHKPELKLPLRPGVWTCKLMINYKVVLESRFLVLPLTTYHAVPLNITQAKLFHNGPQGGLYAERNFSDFKDVLHVNKDNKARTEADRNGVKVGDDLKLWVDTLTKDFWEVHKTCLIEGGGGYCDGLELCKSTTWSTLAPDPKSEIHGINQSSGFLI